MIKEPVNPNLRFSEKTQALVDKIINRYPEGMQKSALLPVLHLAQSEFGGWLSPETMTYVASILKIQPVEVYEVASFYSMYNLKPVGKYMFEVCRTGPCAIRGAGEIVAHLEKKLDVKVGENTPDGMFTIKTVECLASCGTAPMMQLGEKYHENLTPEFLDQLIDNLRNDHNGLS